MRQAATRALFAYWESMRQGRRAPKRGDINPSDIKPLTRDLFILDLGAPPECLFSMIGSRLSSFFRMPLLGDSFLSIWQNTDQEHIADLLRTASEKMLPIVAQIESSLEDSTDVFEPNIKFELLLLPLRFQRQSHARILGSLVPMNLAQQESCPVLRTLTLHMARVLHASSHLPLATQEMQVVPLERVHFAGGGRGRGGCRTFSSSSPPSATPAFSSPVRIGDSSSKEKWRPRRYGHLIVFDGGRA